MSIMMQRAQGARPYQLTIRQILEAPAAYNPAQEIVYRGERRLTYRELRERIHRLAGALSSLGVRPGETVGVMDYDSHRYLESYFAVPMMGAVLHTVNVKLSPEHVLYTLAHAEDDVLLVHEDFLPLLAAARARLPRVRKVVLLRDGGAAPPPGLCDGEYEELLAAAPPRFEFPELDEDTRATTFYSTGTTGLPKGVCFTHRQIVLHTLGLIVHAGTQPHAAFGRDDVYMPLTPMFHVHAWGVPYAATMLGVKQVYAGRYVPDLILKLIVEEKVTFSHSVPTVLHMLLRAPGSEKFDLSRLKLVIGGAALPRALAAAALQRGIDVVGGYGLSETCPVLAIAHLDSADLADPDRAVELRTRTGRAVPLVDMRIWDERGQEVARGGDHTGEIVVRAPWLCESYLKDPQASDALWSNGYLRTGDVGWLDERGFLKITDRIKDAIKVGGEWVSSLQIEEILAGHPAVAEAAVIGAPDSKWGEHPLALVVPRPGAERELGARELVAHARQFVESGQLSKVVVTMEVKFVESIDRTSVGKVDKVALRKKYR